MDWLTTTQSRSAICIDRFCIRNHLWARPKWNLRKKRFLSNRLASLLTTRYSMNLQFRINSTIQINTYKEQLCSFNALEILRPYDLVLDATDNVATRYLLNDACVMLGKPLVSGSALKVSRLDTPQKTLQMYFKKYQILSSSKVSSPFTITSTGHASVAYSPSHRHPKP